MEFTLRCNSTRCRAPLAERAVVTTCSHVYCNGCAESLGLTGPAGLLRHCPACQHNLPNPDDAVLTRLNPTEDYKTSVLSGLNPNIIMECAGRGLAFWSYQCRQEIVFQEYLVKSLTDKYACLNLEMDKIISDANSEIASLNQKVATMQVEQDKLKQENNNLATGILERSRKHQQTMELYDRLKDKEMTAITRSAAHDTVEEALDTISGPSRQSFPNQLPATSRPDHQNDFSQLSMNIQNENLRPRNDNSDQSNRHRRSISNDSHGSGGIMLPPQHWKEPAHRVFGSNRALLTPSRHHTQYGSAHQLSNRLSHHDSGSFSRLQQTPSQRQAVANVGTGGFNRPSFGGYGMSAGLKVGRQQVPRHGDFRNTGQERSRSLQAPPVSQAQQLPTTGGVYF